MKTDQSAFLNHILDAIKKIEKYLQGIDEEAFTKNDLVQDGVIRQIEIIGEAVKRRVFPVSMRRLNFFFRGPPTGQSVVVLIDC